MTAPYRTALGTADPILCDFHKELVEQVSKTRNMRGAEKSKTGKKILNMGISIIKSLYVVFMLVFGKK